MATAEVAPIISGEKLAAGVQTLVSEAQLQKGAQLAPSPVTQLKGEEIRVQLTQTPKVMVTFSSEIPTARPKSIQFGALVHPELRLRKAIPLEVSVEEGHVLLTWNETEEFACGNTMGEALDDFSKTLSELYTELNSPSVRLGADLQKVRHILDDYIERRKK